MKSAEHRDRVVADVQAYFNKYRSIALVPEYSGNLVDPLLKKVVVKGKEQQDYVVALYAMFNQAEQLLGRAGDMLVGK